MIMNTRPKLASRMKLLYLLTKSFSGAIIHSEQNDIHQERRQRAMTGMTDINKATVHRKPNRLLTIVLVFLMGGAAHVFLYGVDIADSICQILYGTSILLWGNNISTRVTDKRIRLLLLTMVVFFALSFLMQVCRFSLLFPSKSKAQTGTCMM